MIKNVIAIFTDEQDQEPSFIALTRNIVLSVMVVNLALLPLVAGLFGEGSRNPPAFITLLITFFLQAVSLIFVLRGSVRMAKVVVPSALLTAVTIISLNTNGLKNTAIVGFPIILIISAVLLGRHALFLVTSAAIISIFIVAGRDLRGDIPYIATGLDDAIILPILLIGCAAIIQLLISRLKENILRARENERIYLEENRELSVLRTTLEERVNQRTSELETANLNNTRRARQFEAVAQVTNAISNIQDLETLLPRIAAVISEQFRHYHTGIFLLDGKRDYAVLRAANSPGGQKMLAREHKLRVGQTGIVGFVTATGQPRIALDVGVDAVYFDNPDLPNTRSEIALPLLITGQVIGAIDAQSEEENAFNSDDITALMTLADQVSIAILNTRKAEDARKSLAEAHSAFADSVRNAWRILQPESIGMGMQWTGSSIKPLEKPVEDEVLTKAIQQGKPEKPAGRIGNLAVPIRLRGQVIGVMNLKNREQRRWTDDDVDIVEAVAERLSLAIESASLLRSAQNKADIERITTDITAKIGSSSRFDTILQTAAEELSKALGGSEVLVQIEPVALKMRTPE